MRRKPHHLRRRRAGFGEWVQLVGAFDVPLGCAGRWECVMEQGRRSGGCVVGTCDLAFDALEPRRLLAGFAGIGFDRVSSTLDAYIIEGTATPSGLASGQVFVSGASGRSTGTPLAREWVEQRDLGSLFLRPSLGAEGRDIELGANFWSSRGYPAGWHAGVDSAPGTGQLSYMIERPATATVAALEGNWIWTVFQWNPSTGAATVLNGTLSVSGNFMLWFATGIGAAPVARTTEITSVGSAGLFETNRGESVYISADGSVMLTADMRESDGDVDTVFRREIEVLRSMPRRALFSFWSFLLLLTVSGILLPGSIIDGIDPFTELDDTTEHLVAFLLLAVLPPLWVVTRGGALSFFVFVLTLALSLEWIQLFSPDRAFEYSDIAMNLSGVVAGSVCGVLARLGRRVHLRLVRF